MGGSAGAAAGPQWLLLLLALAVGAPGGARALGALARDPRRVVARNAFPGFHNEDLRAALAYKLDDLPRAGLTPALVPSLERPGHDVLVVTLTEEPEGEETAAAAAAGAEAGTEAEARGCVVLYAHGNAETVLRAAPKLARVRAETGCRVVAVEYTGYGGWRLQAARPSESALRDDVETAAAWVVNNFPDKDLFFWGWSMGSGAVVAAARRDRAQVFRRLPPGATQQPGAWSRLLLERDPLKGLILESPYLSVLRSRTGRLPAGGLVRGILRGQDMFDNREGLRAVGGVPLLVLAGTADEVIPADQARKLHSEYAGEDKSLLVLPGAGHNNLGDWPYATFFWPRVRRFVHRLSPEASGGELPPGQQAGWPSGGGLFPEVTLQSLFRGARGGPDVADSSDSAKPAAEALPAAPAAAPGLPYIARLPAVQVISEPVEEAVGDWAIVLDGVGTEGAPGGSGAAPGGWLGVLGGGGR